MALSKDHYLDLVRGGFNSTTKADLDHLFTTFAADPNRGKFVTHFHGGLVSEPVGMGTATRLLEVYQTAGSYPVFFVWESGIWEVFQNNLPDIFSERIFQRLVERVTQFVTAKLGQSEEERGSLLELDDMPQVRMNLKPAAEGKEPYAHLDPAALPADVTISEMEEEQLRDTLENDMVLVQEAEAIANTLRTPEEVQAEREDLAATRGFHAKSSTRTLMSPDVLEEIRAEAPTPEERGIVSTTRIIKGAVTVFTKVISRFTSRRDHGVYPTIVEEILREFYLANVGKFVWDSIKQYTSEAFGDDGAKFGGTAFLQDLATQPADGRRSLLIGHSAGSLYICNLLKHADALLPAGVQFEVVFLAPACDFKLFSQTIQNVKHRIANFRLFAMSDDWERKDRLTGKLPLYPRSLLYFISGILEDEPDKPLVGMQRYYSGAPPFDAAAYPEIAAVRDYIAQGPYATVWSPADAGPGLSSQSAAHGDFDDDQTTLQSLQHIITNGF